MLHLAARLILSITLFGLILFSCPRSVSLPGTLPDDPAREDLGRIVYPSQKTIPWRSHFITFPIRVWSGCSVINGFMWPGSTGWTGVTPTRG